MNRGKQAKYILQIFICSFLETFQGDPTYQLGICNLYFYRTVMAQNKLSIYPKMIYSLCSNWVLHWINSFFYQTTHLLTHMNDSSDK